MSYPGPPTPPPGDPGRPRYGGTGPVGGPAAPPPTYGSPTYGPPPSYGSSYGPGSPYGAGPPTAPGLPGMPGQPGAHGAPTVVTCYRHTDRRAGVTCQRCNRPICPSCMMQASVGFQCPECVKANPAPKVPAGFGGRGGVKPIATQVLIGINAAMFLITLVGSPNPAGAFGLSGGSDTPLQLRLLLSGSPFQSGGVRYGGVAGGEYWRLLTGGFLHGGLIHLAMNMFGLWVLGSQLEPMLGRARFLAIYFASLFAGSLGVMILSPTSPTVGASGAIFGLMGAAAILLRARGVNIWQSSLGQVILLNVGITFFVPGISIGGHLGGLAGGALVALAMSKIEATKPDLAKAVAVASAFSVVCIVASIVLANNWRNPLFG